MSGTRELHFEDTVFEFLSESELYTTGKSQNFNLEYVLDKVLLGNFIREAQPEV